jgi:hypothetical protein
MKKIIIVSVVLLFAPHLFAAQQTITQKINLPNQRVAYVYNHGAKIDVKSATGELQQSSCFDACGIPFAKAKTFLKSLQRAVKHDNKIAIAKLIDYPLRVNGQKITVNSIKDFRHHYSAILTAEIKQAILQQNPYTLFANSQGVMLGGGEVWLNMHNNKLLITVINLPKNSSNT